MSANSPKRPRSHDAIGQAAANEPDHRDTWAWNPYEIWRTRVLVPQSPDDVDVKRPDSRPR
jgi:hypothetical protein